MQIKIRLMQKTDFNRLSFVILLLCYLQISIGQPYPTFYGVDDINPAEFRFLRDSLGGNFAMVELSPDSSAWKAALDEAEKYGIKIVIWPLGNGHQWTSWAWDGSNWDISKGEDALKFAESYVNSGGNGLLAVVMSHEPFYNNGDPFTAAEMKLLYSSLKNTAPNVELFVYMNDMAYYDTKANTRIEDGLMDIAGIWLHCFGEAEGSRDDALDEIDRDFALVQDKGLDIRLFFAIQTFAIEGTKYEMPSAEEMSEFGTQVIHKGKLDGVLWYPWNRVSSSYTSYLSKDRYDSDGQDRWKTVRTLSSFIPVYSGSEQLGISPEPVISQNFPNPFESETSVKISVLSYDFYRLNIFDLQGRRLKTVCEGYYIPGRYEYHFSSAGLPPGAYVYTWGNSKAIVTRIMMIK
jgi:hypothetical protein